MAVARAAGLKAVPGRWPIGIRLLRLALGMLAALLLSPAQMRAPDLGAAELVLSDGDHGHAAAPFAAMAFPAGEDSDETSDDAPPGSARLAFASGLSTAPLSGRCDQGPPSRSRSAHFPTGPPAA